MVRSFSFENSCECSEKHELINLLSLFTKTLKTITITTIANRGDIIKPSLFSPSKFAMALCCTYGTLESRIFCVGGSDNYTNGSSLGSLADFAVLKILCVQSHTLLGAEANSLTPLETLRGILPLNLQHFTIHLCNQSTVHHQGADTTSHHEKTRGGECCLPCVGAVYEGMIPHCSRSLLLTQCSNDWVKKIRDTAVCEIDNVPNR